MRQVMQISVEDGVKIEWLRRFDEHVGMQRLGLHSHDRGEPELYEAMRSLTRWLWRLCEMPPMDDEALCKRCAAVRVDWYVDKSENVTVRIRGYWSLKSTAGAVKLATEKTPVDALDEDCAALLEALAGFALRYVDGHRAQTQMFDEDEDDGDRGAAVSHAETRRRGDLN